MTPHQIYNLWETFNRMVEDPSFDTQAKLDMGREMISSLPPEMLCSVSKSSLAHVTKAMQGRLSDIGNTNAIKETPRDEAGNRPKRTTRRTRST